MASVRRVILILALLLWGGDWSLLHAQIGGGALTGTVSDQTGQAVPGAVVTATSLATNQSRSSVTSKDGGYVFQGLAPGAYRLHVELTGFRPLTREGVGLATGETVR